MVIVTTGSGKNKGSKNGLFSAPPQTNSDYYGSGRGVLYPPPPQFRVAKALLCDTLSSELYLTCLVLYAILKSWHHSSQVCHLLQYNPQSGQSLPLVLMW